MTSVLCTQLAPRIADLPYNRELSVAAVRGAAGRGAEVIVLPELVTSGYRLESVAEAASVAIPAEDPLFAEWGRAAPEAVVVGGFCELGADGRLYNSAAVLDRGELVAVYRKTHLWDSEKSLFTPGAEAPPVLDTSGGRIGVLICYDLEFPELTRILALEGAELLAVPTNWPLLPRPAGERVPEVVVAMAAARVNRIAIACCDRSGTERGGAWNEGTSIVGPDGWVRAEVDTAGIARADLELSAARDKRLTERAHLFADRRPELYGPLA
ncbi:putative amidohydrolase [Saccharopolyspora lacisalsi]|uniref:Putative amidohydrolase n=1 Tax=Halosaccharopolyspora lacisalsi TaxID=1000566 RepID=A0A839E0Q0_9PSEU|nr:nitrilase-related carbon-nitrogen hydrolase [Halosaccharopolyspora lacisalsi]MBA8826106.1 putative amidohydrolase [Halosaccharopolyspora lacisalsi]